MEYYKIINDNTIAGVAKSSNFIRYSPVNHCLLYCSKNQGQYIIYNDVLYRDSWMRPIKELHNCIEAEVYNISKEEYDTLYTALQVGEEIKAVLIEDEPIEAPVITPTVTIQFMRDSKISEMSHTCRQTIEAGFDLELRGEMHHFSLDTQDQLNLISLSAMAQTQALIPYHADGEECIFYTAEEINAIVAKATEFKIYHTTYYNALKTYINALDTIEDIAAIQYGTPIPEEYQSDVLKAIQA